MFRKLQLGLFFGIVLSVMVGQSYSADPMAVSTPEAKVSAEKAIKDCETKYAQMKTTREKLVSGIEARKRALKKPGMLSLPKTKKEYEAKIKEEDLFIKAFDEASNDFTRFTGSKFKLRAAKTNNELLDVTLLYKTNCESLKTRLMGYVDWVLTGKAQKGFDVIYKDWIAEARKSK